MSRTTRMLLVVAIFSVAGLLVLGMMIRRYASILERRDSPAAVTEDEESPQFLPGFSSPAADPEPPEAVASETPPIAARDGAGGLSARISTAQEAERYVDALLRVRSGLGESPPRGSRDEPDPGREGSLQAALADAGLERDEYEALEALYRAWRGGRGDPDTPLSAAFERRRADLDVDD